MGALGRGPTDVGGDLELVTGIRAREQVAAKLPQLQDAVQAAHKALIAGVAEIDQGRAEFEESASAKLAALQRAEAQARSPMVEALRAGGELPALQAKWAALAAGT